MRLPQYLQYTVKIINEENPDTPPLGTGFIVQPNNTKDFFILTCYHVVSKLIKKQQDIYAVVSSQYFKPHVYTEPKSLKCECIESFSNVKNDIAVLKVAEKEDLSPAPLGLEG